MEIMSYFELKFGARTILCSARSLPTSLRAEGVAISHEGHYYSNEIASSLSLLAMTEGGG